MLSSYKLEPCRSPTKASGAPSVSIFFAVILLKDCTRGPQNTTHSAKVGVALTLVSLVYYYQFFLFQFWCVSNVGRRVRLWSLNPL
jgi:hypothetical protein